MIDDRDYVGYSAQPPDPRWPSGARIAVNINLNFEGGGERSVMDGDGVSEGLLYDIGFPSLPGLRSPMVESVFEYGSRVGGWRLLRLFRKFGIKICLLAVAKSAERCPEITRAFVEDGHEIVSHGYRWLDYLHQVHRARNAGFSACSHEIDLQRPTRRWSERDSNRRSPKRGIFLKKHNCLLREAVSPSFEPSQGWRFRAGRELTRDDGVRDFSHRPSLLVTALHRPR